MKKTIKYLIACAALSMATSCDDGFVELNTNPYAINNINQGLLFSNAQRLTHAGSWEGEQTVIQ